MLDEHSLKILKEYDDNCQNYIILKSIVLKTLKDIVNEFNMLVNSVEGRIKERNSLQGKLERKGYKYNSIFDITDIVGTRVVTFFDDEVDKIASVLSDYFDIDWENSVDKRALKNIDQFGYMSLHFICRLKKEKFYDSNHPEINNIPFEIQIRTVLQHAWASIEHDINYKSKVEIPKIYSRRLLSLAGMLELADSEFRAIRVAVNEYNKKIMSIAASGNLNDIELSKVAFDEYINAGAFKSLNERIAEINNMDIINVSLDRFLIVFQKFGFNTLGEVDKMRKDYEELAYKFALSQFGAKDIDIITSSVALMCICTVYIIKNKLGNDMLKFLYDTVMDNKNSNESRVNHAIEIGKKIGLE